MTKSKGGYKIRPDGKKDTGRPTRMTAETINKLEQAFSIGASDLEACCFANIGATVLYTYQREHPEFAQRKALLREKLPLKARSVVAGALQNNDVNTARWYLEKRKPDEFGNKVQVEDVTPPKIIDDIAVIMEMQGEK